MKDIYQQIHEVWHIPNSINAKQTKHRPILIKLLKTTSKKTVLKETREKKRRYTAFKRPAVRLS